MRLYFAAASIPSAPPGRARAVASATAYGLLPALLQRASLPPTSAIEKNAEGRPFLPTCPQADFSISHTAALAFCLLAVDDEKPPRVGIDAEPCTISADKALRLTARFLAPQERKYVSESADVATAFLEVFTCKEAFAKYVGTGLAKTLKIDTVCPHFSKSHHVQLHRLHYGDHIVSLCLPEGTSTNGICFLGNAQEFASLDAAGI